MRLNLTSRGALLALLTGCSVSIHPSNLPPAKSHDPPHDIMVLSEPPGAMIVVGFDTLSALAPVVVRHSRTREFGVPDPVGIRALAITPDECSQFRDIPADGPLPDTIVFRMTNCPSPDFDYSRVFAGHDVTELPKRVHGPLPFYPEPLLSAHRQGIVWMQVVIDTTGVPEPSTFRVVVASDSGFNKSAREFLLGSVYTPGRVRGRKVRTLITQPLIYTTSP